MEFLQALLDLLLTLCYSSGSDLFFPVYCVGFALACFALIRRIIYRV